MVIRELNGKDIEDVTAQGVGQLTSRPAGRAMADSAAPGAAAPAAGKENVYLSLIPLLGLIVSATTLTRHENQVPFIKDGDIGSHPEEIDILRIR
ncbi:hypothetical protein ACRRTK_022899 [Alexandromys fortis]